jgi:hypothetical protein
LLLNLLEIGVGEWRKKRTEATEKFIAILLYGKTNKRSLLNGWLTKSNMRDEK